MDWTELGRQWYRQGSTAPAPAPTSTHSCQQITTVETISGRTAVLPLTWAPTSHEQLASRFIVPPPAPQHNPSASAGSYSSASFLARSACKPFHRASLRSTVHSTRFATFLWHLLFWTFQRKTSRELRCQLNFFDNHPTGAQQLFTTPSVFDHQQAAKHTSPTTSRACSRRLREYTADEAPNKRAVHTPQQIVGIGTPSLLSVLRPVALDVSPVKIPIATSKL